MLQQYEHRRRVRSPFVAWAARRLRDAPVDRPPSAFAIRVLSIAWGNIGYRATFRYLRHIADVCATTDGAVLECGSGVSTMLLAALTERTGRALWALEHHRAWADNMADILSRYGFSHARVCHAPLRSYDGYDWYDTSGIAWSGSFTFVVCDGPPGRTPGGRFGLVPRVGHLLAPGCQIVLDDTHRARERDIIRRWGALRPLAVRHYHGLKRFANLTTDVPFDKHPGFDQTLESPNP